MAELEQLKLDCGGLFPWYFKFIGIMLGIVGLVVFASSWAAGLVLLLLSGIILTARSGLIVDGPTSRYKEYNSFLFIKLGSWEKYSSPESIFINSSKVTQKISTYHTMQSTTDVYLEYNGYLKFASGRKVHVDSMKDKGLLLNKLNRLSAYMNIDIVDYTA